MKTKRARSMQETKTREQSSNPVNPTDYVSSIELAFEADLLKEPLDLATRLIYADYLEQEKDTINAMFQRELASLLGQFPETFILTDLMEIEKGNSLLLNWLDALFTCLKVHKENNKNNAFINRLLESWYDVRNFIYFPFYREGKWCWHKTSGVLVELNYKEEVAAYVPGLLYSHLAHEECVVYNGTVVKGYSSLLLALWDITWTMATH